MPDVAALLSELSELPPARQAERIRAQADPDALLVALGDEAERLAVVEVQRALRASELVMLLADELGRARGRVRARRARAQALAYSGQMDLALRTCQEAIEIGETTGEQIEASRARLASMHALGELGRYDEAIEAGEHAYRTFVSFDEPDLQARADINLGVVHQNRDAPQRALFHFQRASATLPPDAGQLPFFVENNSGEALLLLNDFAGAEAAFARAGRHADRLEAPFARALAEGNLADLHARCGRLQQALFHFERARRALEQDEANSHTARLLAEQAEVLAALGMNDEARRTFQAALPQLEGHGQAAELARAALGLAEVESRRGQQQAADLAVRQAIQRYRAIGQERAAALAELRRMEMLTTADPEAAALRLTEIHAHLDERPLDRAAVARAAAQLALVRNEPREAYRLALAGLSELEAVPFAPLAAELLRQRALAERDLGQVPAAVDSIREAIAQFERTRGLLQSERFRAAFAATRADVFAEATEIFLADKREGRLANVFEALERSRSRNLLDRTEQPAEDIATSGDDGQLQRQATDLRAELSGLYSRVADLHFSGGAPQQADALRTRLLEREAVLRECEQRLAATWRTEHLPVEPASLEQAQTVLAADEAVLAYLPVGDQVRVLLLTSAAAELVPLRLTRDELHGRLQRFRFQIARQQRPPASTRLQAQSAADLQRELDWLGDRLLTEPLAELDGCRQIGIVPFGPLYGVPFAGLRVESEYFVTRCAPYVVPSVSILARLRQRPPTPDWQRHALVIGCADELAPRIEEEAAAVADLLPEARLLRGPDATTTAFAAAAHDAGLVHLACHGHYDQAGTTQAGLRLADRWFGFRELYRLRMTARLVTLSGCETGRGSVGRDEQLTGMLGGFLRSGVQSVLCTLWPVADQPATELALCFYRHLAAGTPGPAAALAAAQRERNASGADPLDWAAHTLVGLP